MVVSMSSKRQEIVESAKVLFARHGYVGVSLDAIIDDTRTSKGTLYYHFDSKEDLYATALEDMLEELWACAYDDGALDAATRETFWPTLVAGWKRSIEHMLENPDKLLIWRGFQAQWRLLPDSGPARRIRQRNLEMGCRIARRGQEVGCVRRDLTPLQCAELVESLDTVTDGWFFDLYAQHGASHAFDEQTPRTLDLVWRLLMPNGDLQARCPEVHASA